MTTEPGVLLGLIPSTIPSAKESDRMDKVKRETSPVTVFRNVPSLYMWRFSVRAASEI